ncbi:MAG TPA: hypothetical protein VGQ76_14885 [Thermoanaerobaculia bacterium]|jgi:hypothetical protein|nr:hypothetical protein [Thermoanaerobaculia bacterium]
MLVNVTFALAVVASVFLWSYVRRNATTGRRSALFARGLLELTVPLSVATGIFVVLQFRLARMTATSATSTIAQIESVIGEIRNTYLKELNPPAWLQLVCLFVIFAGGLLWPNVRAAMLMQKYKIATQWVARAFVLMTFLASFTFFGGSYNGGLAAADAKLVKAETEIRLLYGDLHREIDDTLLRYSILTMIEQPEVATSAADAVDIVRAFKREQQETREARSEIERVSNSGVDFEITSRIDPSRPASQRRRAASTHPPAVDERSWSRARGETLHRELKTERAAAGVDRPELTILTETTIDAVHEQTGKVLLAALVGDGPLRALLEVAIDPGVLYNLRDVAAKRAIEAYREIAAGRELRNSFAAKKAEIRAELSALAKRSGGAVQIALSRAATLWRIRAAQATEAHKATTREINSKLAEQYRREAVDFAERWRVTYRFPQDHVTRAAGYLLDETLQRIRTTKDPVDRLTLLRETDTRLAFEETPRPTINSVARLVEFEQEHHERRVFHDALSPFVYYAMSAADQTQWGRLRTAAHEQFKARADQEGRDLYKITDRWETAKHRSAIGIVIMGTDPPSAAAWEAAFYEHCRADAEAAVVWGWIVKDQYSETTESAYGKAVPENGFRRYLEATGVGGIAEANQVFSTPLAERTINRFCKPAGATTRAPATEWGGLPRPPIRSQRQPPRPRPRVRGR